MSWFVDNANLWYVLLGMVALGFGTAWWLRRKTKYLLGTIVAVGVIFLLWLLTRLIVTDRQQLELDVRAMAAAVLASKSDVLLKHLANDFEFQGLKRQDIGDHAGQVAKRYRISDIVISAFDVEELKERSATVYFRATIHGPDGPHMLGCRVFFVKENDQWRVKEVGVYNPLVNQNQPITVPF
jgi:hypothetical protein